MRYRVLIIETNIDEEARPRVFRYLLDAPTEADAAEKAKARFTKQHRREPAPRAVIDVQPLDN